MKGTPTTKAMSKAYLVEFVRYTAEMTGTDALDAQEARQEPLPL